MTDVIESPQQAAPLPPRRRIVAVRHARAPWWAYLAMVGTLLVGVLVGVLVNTGPTSGKVTISCVANSPHTFKVPIYKNGNITVGCDVKSIPTMTTIGPK